MENLLKDHNPSKATGPDDISSTDLKLAAKDIAGTIAILFNESLQTGDLPDEFKLGHVIPILKPAETDTSLPSSYRGLTLTSILSKVLEKVVYNQVNMFLNDTHALNEQRYGFRKGRSCADLLTATVDDWLLARDRKRTTAIVFLDLSKAFDNVQHEQLLLHLQKMNIGGTVLKWFSNYLKGRSQKVVLHGHNHMYLRNFPALRECPRAGYWGRFSSTFMLPTYTQWLVGTMFLYHNLLTT